ncbi:MAG: L-glutamate gamma-semialdehyde dehydrogenase [Gemmatimonadetes bacterium]|nr:L-glutamate gamma-semialdehyde dehydrogenase [Gemmatimonadota bacterium]MCA9761661.1 L-glutamate gamma-semialdehyde dehydrogenase [Gemmatimonadota bacterium]MCB9505428.1 L-glutamate gamma-semialdehyde dehydrogenase [Gemmatimonadales bacterium]MCB9518702.1 L-glutamate gamma-semialdehyde dehydrogenase [Gemmatimonadales bacterium]HPF60617.1 L-glutamate gamma-semialdehyde dehydrogenase [Gemmatimonadales bacterium]
MSAIGNIPAPVNEPILSYAPGTPERDALQSTIASMGAEVAEIPVVVNGTDHHVGEAKGVFSPQRHQHRLANLHGATPALLGEAIDGAVRAQREWSEWRFEDRAAVFLKAAELLAGPWRQRLNAATLLGQGKTPHQAEIDSACELIDFLRFNVHYAERLLHEQPMSSRNAWNRLDHRPLEGFVYAVTPFNFTAIGGNLPTAPALLGNVVLWKPSHTAALSNWLFHELLQEAGLPPGVIQFVPGNSVEVTEALLASPHFAGLHFTGSTAVFRSLWRTSAEHLDRYRAYPRIVGETGGKDFILAHPSADVAAFTTALLRGAYEYQGQKCSAASRCYVPRSLWPEVRDRMAAGIAEMQVGDPADFSVFVGAVIDERAWTKLDAVLAEARADSGVEIVAGGTSDRSEGWFIAPTFARVDDPHHRMMREEFFGPILTAYVYEDDQWADVLRLVDTTAEYALTGAVFAQDRAAVVEADRALRHAAGNYYVNDKCTGAVVGQQPFGGGRASGTNDKAGSILNLYRWISPRTVKEVGDPPTDWRYPYLG